MHSAVRGGMVGAVDRINVDVTNARQIQTVFHPL